MILQLKQIADYLRYKLNISDAIQRNKLREKIQEADLSQNTVSKEDKILAALCGASKKIIYKKNGLTKSLKYAYAQEFYFTSLTEVTFDNTMMISLDVLIFDALTKMNGTVSSNESTTVKNLIIKTPEVCSVASVSITNLFNRTEKLKIYVPDNLVNDYKNATNWTIVENKIFPLSDYYLGGENE